MGLYLNLHVVIHWDLLGVASEETALERQARFLDRIGKWLNRHNKPLAYIWTTEVARWKGRHTHLMLSARLNAHDLSELLRRLPKFMMGPNAAVPRGAIEVAPNMARLPHAPDRSGRLQHRPAQRKGNLAYILKGAEPDIANTVGINPEGQGPVQRRCGSSRSLGWAARRRAGWIEQDLQDFDFHEMGARRRAKLANRPCKAPQRPTSPREARTSLPSILSPPLSASWRPADGPAP
ncbi:MAG: hypothetical protein E6Q43_07295 [Dokdonella sp.]|nr:MAG: hypothetical protein E6Q43_07295 [Dokdonella sp.]